MAIKYEPMPEDFAVLHQPQNADLKPQRHSLVPGIPDTDGVAKGDLPLDMPEFPSRPVATIPFKNLNERK